MLKVLASGLVHFTFQRIRYHRYELYS